MEEENNTNDTVKQIRQVMIAFQRRVDTLENNFDAMKDEFKSQLELIKKFQVAIEQIGESGASNNANIAVSDSDLSDMIKKVLLDDKELAMTFKKIIENVYNFNTNKIMIDEKVEKNVKSANKINGKVIELFIIGFAGLACLALGGYYYLQANKYITIKAGTEIFSTTSNIPSKLVSNYEIKPISQNNKKVYFIVNGKKYYYIK